MKSNRSIVPCSEFSMRAVDIHEKSGPDFTQELGYSLSTLGSSNRYLNRFVAAEIHLKKALEIFESVDSPSKLRVTKVNLYMISEHPQGSRLSSLLQSLGRLKENIK